MPDHLRFQFGLGRTPAPLEKSPDRAMRILMLGDFSGRGDASDSAGIRPLDESRLHSIDIDSFDAVMTAIGPQLDLARELGDRLRFRCLDDFHPDRLFAAPGVFHNLRQLREMLLDSRTFSQAAAQLGASATESEGADVAPSPAPQENEDALFERLLGRSLTRDKVLTDSQQAAVDRLISDIVAPHIAPHPDPRQAELLAAVDKAAGERMRALLHHPRFQALESAWRSVWELVSRLETDESLQLFLMDATREELADGIGAAGADLADCPLYRLVVDRGIDMADGNPWSLLVGNYRFGPNTKDARLLAAIGAIASRAGGPFLAAAEDTLLGCPSLGQCPNPAQWQHQDDDFANHWRQLRESPYAPWIGLALPCILLRLPYGSNTDPVETFDFEELPQLSRHADFLWGNPAFACARLIAESFTAQGWAMSPGSRLDVNDLPAYVYRDQDESKMQACAEWYLTERQGEAILEQGLMPLLSYHNRNSAKLLRLQSIASPAQALALPFPTLR